MNITAKDISDLAKEASKLSEEDWKKINISENDIYDKISNGVINQFTNIADEDKMKIALATIVRLLVERTVNTIQKENNV